jgi:hypothetical protein
MPAPKPDYISPIAKAIAELINSKPRSPTLEELQAFLRDAYLASFVSDEQRMLPIETCRELIEGLVPDLAAGIHALTNSRMRSPTIREIRDVLAPPRPKVAKVYVWEGKVVSREEQQRLREEAYRIAADQHLEECACARCLEDLERAYVRSAARYVRYLERIGHEPHAEYPEAELWVKAREMADLRKPVVIW